MSGAATRTRADLPPSVYVVSDDAQRCCVCMTVRESDGEDGYTMVTRVVTGWAELDEGFLHFIDDDHDAWQSFPQLAVNWIEWQL